jgi:hypothetical protein
MSTVLENKQRENIQFNIINSLLVGCTPSIRNYEILSFLNIWLLIHVDVQSRRIEK